MFLRRQPLVRDSAKFLTATLRFDGAWRSIGWVVACALLSGVYVPDLKCGPAGRAGESPEGAPIYCRLGARLCFPPSDLSAG